MKLTQKVLAALYIAAVLSGCSRSSEPTPEPRQVEERAPAVQAEEGVRARDAGESAVDADALSGATMGKTGKELVKLDGAMDTTALLALHDKLIAAERDKPVYVTRGTDPRRVAHDLMNELSPAVGAGLPVLIKPNIGGFNWFKKGADDGVVGRITDPAFVEGIIDYLEENGVARITVAESWGTSSRKDVARLFRVSGYEALASRHPAVTLVDLNTYGDEKDTDPPPVRVSIPGTNPLPDDIVLPKLYVDHLREGLVIDVPKLKTHRLAVVSAGMKNLMGVLGFAGSSPPHAGKWRMHRELKGYLAQKDAPFGPERRAEFRRVLDLFSERVCELYRVAHPHMTLVDGVLTLEGDGFDEASSVPLGIGVGSYNTVFADVEAARRAGFWRSKRLEEHAGFDSPPYLVKALERFYGSAGVAESIKVFDEGPPKSAGNLRLESMGPFTVQGTVRDSLAGGGEAEAIYLGADPVSFDRFFAKTTGREVFFPGDWRGEPLPPGVATGAAVGYTDEQLLFGFTIRYRSLRRPEHREEEMPDLFKGDVVEVFVDPDPSTPSTYLELEADAAGNRLDLAVDKEKGVFDAAFESGMTVETSVDEAARSARILIRVPLSGLAAVRPEGVWRAGFFRTEGVGEERLYSAWRPTGTEKPRFHVPEVFGRLVFPPTRRALQPEE